MNKDLEQRHIAAQLAGYLSGFPDFTSRHPEELLPLAKHCITGLSKILDETTARRMAAESALEAGLSHGTDQFFFGEMMDKFPEPQVIATVHFDQLGQPHTLNDDVIKVVVDREGLE